MKKSFRSLLALIMLITSFSAQILTANAQELDEEEYVEESDDSFYSEDE